MEGPFMPFEFDVDVISTPFDENDVSIYHSLAQVHTGDFFNIKIHVRNLIICVTREELQRPLSRIPYLESLYENNMILACPQFLESGLVSVFPDNIIPHVLLHIMEPNVMALARDLCEDGDEENSGCRMFNLVIDITVEKLYDDVVNMMIEESAREVRTVPATKTAIESLKKVNLEKGMATESCSICLEDFNGEEEEVIAMPCKHMYHEQCIIQWLQSCDTCPLCRHSINETST